MRALVIGIAAAAFACGIAYAHHSRDVDWHYYGEDGANSAFYGVPNSGDFAISLSCEKPGRIKLEMPFASDEIGNRKAGAKVTFTVLFDLPEGERKQVKVTGTVVIIESEGDLIETVVPANHPIVNTLAKSEAFAMGTASTWFTLEGAKEVVTTMLERCR